MKEEIFKLNSMTYKTENKSKDKQRKIILTSSKNICLTIL